MSSDTNSNNASPLLYGQITLPTSSLQLAKRIYKIINKDFANCVHI